jgi:hypothetical protein
VTKSKTKPPKAPILPRGKKPKPVKKAGGLGPGPHHAGTYKGKK